MLDKILLNSCALWGATNEILKATKERHIKSLDGRKRTASCFLSILCVEIISESYFNFR